MYKILHYITAIGLIDSSFFLMIWNKQYVALSEGYQTMQLALTAVRGQRWQTY